jgi:hypothetical protein
MATLLSHPPTRRARHAETAPSVASLKQRWRQAIIVCGLPIKQRFDLVVMLEHAGGFNGCLSIAAAPTWAILAGVLRQRAGAYDFDRDWLVQAEADAERRWIERHSAKPMRATCQPATTAVTEPVQAQQ